MAAMNRGFYVDAFLCLVGFAAFTAVYMGDPTTGAIDWRPFLATIAGLALGMESSVWAILVNCADRKSVV